MSYASESGIGFLQTRITKKMRITEKRRAELENPKEGPIYKTIAELFDHKNDLVEENQRLRKFILDLHHDCLVALM